MDMPTDSGAPGLGFGLSEEQEMIASTVRSFVEHEIYPHEEAWSSGPANGRPDEVADRTSSASAIELGFYACNFPEEVGGAGLSSSRLRAGRAGARARLHGAHPFLRAPAEHPDGLRGGAARALPPAGRAGRADGCAGDDGARCRLRRALHEMHGAARRRRLGGERDEAFHLRRRSRGFRDRVRGDRGG